MDPPKNVKNMRLVFIFSRESFFLDLLPPEAALPRSPNKSGQDFSGQEMSWPGNFPASSLLAGTFPGQIFLAGKFPSQNFSG